jgi:hypothetical protein
MGGDKGFLAERSRFVRRLQSAMVSPEGEGLVGGWVVGSPPTVLHLAEGRLRWLIRLPKPASDIHINAEYSVSKDNIVYALITRIDHGTTEARFPEEDDTFSFRFRLDEDSLTVKDLKGKGFEELKRAAQGRYSRKTEP